MGLLNRLVSSVKNLFGQKTEVTENQRPKTHKKKKNKSTHRLPQGQPLPPEPLAPKKKKKKKKKAPSVVPTTTSSSSLPQEVGDWQLPPMPEICEPETVYFQQLPLDIRLQKAILGDLKFKACSPIQGLSLPHTINGQDLCGRAQTGTGKTAAFLISVMQRLLHDQTPRKANQPYALILAPTRELAMQIDKDATKLSPYTTIKHRVIYGGIDYKKQQKEIESGCDILTATPGRLLDYIRNRVIDLSQVAILVIDEADRMLDMGFIPDVKRIINVLGIQPRQTLFFSATLTPEVLRLAKNWLNNPVNVEIGSDDELIAETINEFIFSISESEKIDWLLRFLKEVHYERVMIFCNRKRDVEYVYQQLKQKSRAKIERLSGDVDQKKRFRLLEQFRNGDLNVLVATDVAGRGIHINGISHVINYDMPYEAENYVHRIGRTGRAGKSGIAISLACENGCFMIADIEEYIKRPLPFSDTETWWQEHAKTGKIPTTSQAD